MKHLVTPYDVHLFAEGSHVRLYKHFGAHASSDGVHFGVWAPNAKAVSVMGDFNGWRQDHSPLSQQHSPGVWTGFVAGVSRGARYKYHVKSRLSDYGVDKADPFALYSETPPGTASVVWDLAYEWGDGEWMKNRHSANSLSSPLSIYEVHLGSWRRRADGGPLDYREIGEALSTYVKSMGFTHVEFLPVMEHPFYGSWGYQCTGYFAPTARYGTPQDLMWLIDCLHRSGIGVILDWVPSHFPGDEHGLVYFDGTHLYEHADPRQGLHPDWNSYIFNYGRNEVRSFLMSSAMFWLDRYHADGLRMDAVASMLYLDYSRREGAWIPNEHGGRENLEAIGFMRELNTAIYREYPDTQTIAEESTAWPQVSRPVHVGGLGFGMKWDMGWMHDTLKYMSQDPFLRKYHHHELTFRALYAFQENFVLPLSHDEVVHGKGSLLAKMPGDVWQKFANLRVLLAYMWAQPGKKLLFMGGEFGQWTEWNHESALDWALLDSELHAKLRLLVGYLNDLYGREPALREHENALSSFEWVDVHDAENNVLSFLRKAPGNESPVMAVFNFSPVPRSNYRLGAPRRGYWAEILNTDAVEFGGSGQGNLGGVETVPVPLHGRLQSLTLTLPPLGALLLRASE